MSPSISLHKASYSFRQGFWLKRRTVLREITFDIKPGTIFGLIGANGAGKTTLIHLLAGMRAPESGEVLIGSRPASDRESRRLIGFLPERPYFHGFLTGREFLRTMASLSGVPRSEQGTKIERALDLVSLTSAADRRLSAYSKGMLQRIGIAQAVLHDPPIVILDEPMSGLDPLWRRHQREWITRLGSEGKTVLFSSHSLDDVEQLCDQAGMIRDGRIVLRGSAEWPAVGTEIIASGISEDAVPRVAGVTASAHKGGVRIVLPAASDSGPVLAELIRRGAVIKAVHSAPIEWEGGA